MVKCVLFTDEAPPKLMHAGLAAPPMPRSDIISRARSMTSQKRVPVEPLCNTVRTSLVGTLDTIGQLSAGSYKRERERGRERHTHTQRGEWERERGEGERERGGRERKKEREREREGETYYAMYFCWLRWKCVVVFRGRLCKVTMVDWSWKHITEPLVFSVCPVSFANINKYSYTYLSCMLLILSCMRCSLVWAAITWISLPDGLPCF